MYAIPPVSVSVPKHVLPANGIQQTVERTDCLKVQLFRVPRHREATDSTPRRTNLNADLIDNEKGVSRNITRSDGRIYGKISIDDTFPKLSVSRCMPLLFWGTSARISISGVVHCVLYVLLYTIRHGQLARTRFGGRSGGGLRQSY